MWMKGIDNVTLPSDLKETFYPEGHLCPEGYICPDKYIDPKRYIRPKRRFKHERSKEPKGHCQPDGKKELENFPSQNILIINISLLPKVVTTTLCCSVICISCSKKIIGWQANKQRSHNRFITSLSRLVSCIKSIHIGGGKFLAFWHHKKSLYLF